LRQLDALSYEAKEARFIQSRLPCGVEVLELGASLGIISSVILARRPSRLVSYEPVPELAEIARQMVAHNHPGAPWELVCAAVDTAGSGQVEFRWSPQRSQGGAVGQAGAAEETIRVPAESLAAIIARHRLPNSAWLVMDIEGMELRVARSQPEALRHFAGIIVETHDVREADRLFGHSQVLREIADAGFDVVGRRGRVAVLLRRPS
jgi:FkbM family methyltransferase